MSLCRAWHHRVKLHFHLHGHYRGSAVSEDLERFLNHGAQRNRWDYTTIIDTWRDVFGDDFKIIHYQGIVDDPRATIREIADFLDFEMPDDTDDRSGESFFHSSQNQNKQSGLPRMGSRENQVLARMLEPEFERFAEAYPKMGSLWLDRLWQKRFDLLFEVAREMPHVDFLCWGKAVLDAPPDLEDLPVNIQLQKPFMSYE